MSSEAYYPPGAYYDSSAPWKTSNPIEEYGDMAVEYLEQKAAAVDSDFLDFVADNFSDLFAYDINPDTFNELEEPIKAHIRSEFISVNFDKTCYDMYESNN